MPDADHPLRFAVAGDAEVIGVGNGNPTSLEPDHASERRAFHGLAQAIVRVGTSGGPIAIRASADGLGEGRISLLAKPGRIPS